MSAQAPQSEPRVWPMYRAMVGVGLLCGLLIVSVFEVTRPIVARNRAAALERAIFQLLPAARSSRSFRRTADGFEAAEATAPGEPLLHAGYDAERRLVGFAIEGEAMGYQDVIRLLYGYAPARDAVIGIRVLESRETPGLGDRIEKDAEFLENFVQLDVALTPDGSRLRHPIEGVKHGRKQHAWQVDGITGATISSLAVAEALRDSTAEWLPEIRRAQGDLQGAE